MHTWLQISAASPSTPSKTRRRDLRILFSAALVLTWSSYAQAQKQDAEKAAAKADKSVVLTGHIARQHVRVEDSVRFWVTIENPSDNPLTNLRLDHMDTPGFGPPQHCWGSAVAANCGLAAGAQDVCQVPGNAAVSGSGGDLLCAELPAHQSFTFWGDLPAKQSESNHRNFAVLGWQQDGRGSMASVDLGETETAHWLVSPFLTLRGKPEVTLPAGLALLGLWAASWARKREERAQMANTMLAESHKASMQYNMPAASMIAAAGSALRTYFEASPAGPPAAPAADPAESKLRLGFYYLTMYQWWHQQMFREVGAYHFKNRTGEMILRTLYGKHKDLFPLIHDEQRRKLDKVLVLVRKETTVDDFLGLLEYPRTDVAEAWGIFRAWAATDGIHEDRHVLEAYRAVLVFEVNRAYLTWHGALVPPELTPEASELIKVCDILGNQRKSRAETEEYLIRAEIVTRETRWQRLRYGVGKLKRTLGLR